jgi:hypothetical protein
MTRDEHKARHVMLHQHFDELLADYLYHNREARPSTMSMMDFLKWSYQQTIEPAELKPLEVASPITTRH